MRVIRPDRLPRACRGRTAAARRPRSRPRPSGAGLDGFDWRVSMARVAAERPVLESSRASTGRWRSSKVPASGWRSPAAHPIELTAASRTAVVPGGSADHGDAGRRPGARPQRHDPPQRSSSTPSPGSPSSATGSCGIDGSTALLLCRSGSLDVEIGGESADAAGRGDAAGRVACGRPLEPARQTQTRSYS